MRGRLTIASGLVARPGFHVPDYVITGYVIGGLAIAFSPFRSISNGNMDMISKSIVSAHNLLCPCD